MTDVINLSLKTGIDTKTVSNINGINISPVISTSASDLSHDGTNLKIFNKISGSLFLGTSNASRLVIDSSGNITFTGILSGNGSGLTALNGSSISSGLVAQARLGSGTANSAMYLRGDSTWQTLDKTAVGLSNLANIAQSTWTGNTTINSVGTITTGTWSGLFGAVSGANLTNLNGSNISSGTISPARLGSGTANSGSVLRGDNTWVATTDIGATVVSDDTTTNNNFYPVFTNITSGNLNITRVATTKLTYNPSTGTLTTSNFVGNASSATILATTRTISITGDLTYSVSFNGSANVSGTSTLANSGVVAGTYTKVVVDSKGRVTSGSNPSTLTGLGLTLSGAVSTIADTNLPANRLLHSDGSGKVAVSSITSTEIGYLSGASSNIQTQINSKANISGATFSGDVRSFRTASPTTGVYYFSQSNDKYLFYNGTDFVFNGGHVYFQGKNLISVNNVSAASINTTSFNTSTATIGTIISDGRSSFGNAQVTNFILNDASGCIEAKAHSSSTAANIVFHKPGVYAAKFGLNSANQFEWGGWSMSPARALLDSQGNFTVAGKIYTTGVIINGTELTSDLTKLLGATSAVVGDKAVIRNSSGYIFSNYYNMTANDIGLTAITRIPVETSSDGYLRWTTPANLLATMNRARIFRESNGGTMAPGNIYSVNTNAAPVTMNMPTRVSSQAGDTIVITQLFINPLVTWANNNFTIACPAGVKINQQSNGESLVCNTTTGGFTLVCTFVDGSNANWSLL